jgi:hydrogenase expression/formation protein HypD
MRYVDEFRDPVAAKAILAWIAELAGDDPFAYMEVCGGHTHTIARHGLEDLLPERVTLVHGPGCPVCVIPMGRIDDAIAVAEHPEVILTTFGDLLRVPGGRGSLLEAKARGADVRVVYSPLDAVDLAGAHPDRQVVFLAIGFETTAPSTAAAVLRARDLGRTNFSILCNHVVIGPPLEAILDAPDLRLEGFLGPGHVSTVIGTRPYRFVAERYGRPLVVVGFEPIDILQGVAMLLAQHREGRCEVENQYRRAVSDDGNPAALEAIATVFELRETFEWRGLGTLPRSGLRLRDDLATFDAERRFPVPGASVADPRACQCGEVLRGVIRPTECRVFGTACTPDRPIGACMVSAEGACAAAYRYRRLDHPVR